MWAQDQVIGEVDYEKKYHQALKEYAEFEKDHGHYIQTENVKMHYTTWGNPEHTPLVWIHGTYQNTTELLEIVDSIVAAGIYVIAIDYYGHGLTRIPTKEVSIYHVADDINYLLESLKIEKTIVGGWSRGGTIASAFYDTYSDKVLGLILEDGGSANWLVSRQKMETDAMIEKYQSMLAGRKDTVFTSEYEAYQYHYDKTDESSQYWLLAYIKQNEYNQWNINIGLSDWLEETKLEESVDGILKTSTCTLFKSSTLFLQPLVVYRSLDVPLLIIDPTKDDAGVFMNLRVENEKLKANHPDLVTHLIYENATHSVHYQQPKKFTKDVLDFIAGLKK